MRRRQPIQRFSSSSSDGSDSESCFDIETEQEETDTDTDVEDTDLTDVPIVGEGCDEADLADLAWSVDEDNAHPPEFYLDQENNSDESEDEDEDYREGSVLLLDMIEGLFYRCAPHFHFTW
jgi:hypothetical protein